MKRLVVYTAAVALVIALVCVPVRAQWTVWDPGNYAEAVAQFEQMIKEYELLLEQAKRLPIDMAARYHIATPTWLAHDLSAALYAGGVLKGLNQGDPTGAGYRSMADVLDALTDVAGRVPDAIRGPLQVRYGDLELADAVAATSIDQVGRMRQTSGLSVQAIERMEADAFSGDASFQTQTAILNKINAASVLGLRVAAQNHEFLGDTLEQLLVDNKRKRDTEARLMNATVNQWRYGQPYGADLYGRTAADIDRWRPF
jgi:hypothetical protein